MSEKEKLGSFETTVGKMQKLLQWASAPFEDKYDQCYFNVAKDEIRTIANAGQAVVSYCDFGKPFIQDFDLHEDVDSEAGMQAILKVSQVQNYLHFVGGKKLSVEFYGSTEGECKADKMVLDGNLRAEIFLPSSDSDYKSKQLKIVDVYNEDNEWEKPSNGEPLETSFNTEVKQFNKIIDIVSFDSFALSNYPVVIQDGEFMLNASDENERDSIEGNLQAWDVEGPDVNNSYSRSFEELFGSISGDVSIGIEQDSPISIVREANDGAITLRYSILPATS